MYVGDHTVTLDGLRNGIHKLEIDIHQLLQKAALGFDFKKSEYYKPYPQFDSFNSEVG